MPPSAPALGLVLLTGGRSSRMGEPKYAIPHPEGGSWSGHLVKVFETAFPGAHIRILGDAVPERPELIQVEDPRQGPAAALKAWAQNEKAPCDWWWLTACDQICWTPEALQAWFQRVSAPVWTLGRTSERFQPMGSWFPRELLPLLAQQNCRSLYDLLEGIPHRQLEVSGPEWMDLDTPEERRQWEKAHQAVHSPQRPERLLAGNEKPSA